jgi:hypothetical protein
VSGTLKINHIPITKSTYLYDNKNNRHNYGSTSKKFHEHHNNINRQLVPLPNYHNIKQLNNEALLLNHNNDYGHKKSYQKMLNELKHMEHKLLFLRKKYKITNNNYKRLKHKKKGKQTKKNDNKSLADCLDDYIKEEMYKICNKEKHKIETFSELNQNENSKEVYLETLKLRNVKKQFCLVCSIMVRYRRRTRSIKQFYAHKNSHYGLN